MLLIRYIYQSIYIKVILFAKLFLAANIGTYQILRFKLY